MHYSPLIYGSSVHALRFGVSTSSDLYHYFTSISKSYPIHIQKQRISHPKFKPTDAERLQIVPKKKEKKNTKKVKHANAQAPAPLVK